MTLLGFENVQEVEGAEFDDPLPVADHDAPQNRAFFARVHESYLAIAAREPQRVVVVDARGTPAQTHRRIIEAVVRKLKLTARTA